MAHRRGTAATGFGFQRRSVSTAVKPEVEDPEVRADMDMLAIGSKAAEEELWDKGRDNIDYLLGRQLKRRGFFTPVITNLFYSITRVMTASVYSRNPKARVKAKVISPEAGTLPKEPEARELWKAAIEERNKRKKMIAQMGQALLDHTNKETGLKAEARMCIQASTLVGRSAMQIGFGATQGKPRKKKGEKIYETPETGNRWNPGVPTDISNTPFETRKERVWAQYLTPFRYYYDPAVTRMKESPWVCIEYYQLVDDAKNNKNYLNAKKLRATDTMDSRYLEGLGSFDNRNFRRSGPNARFVPKTARYVIVQEILDIKNQEVRVVIKGNENLGYQRRRKWPWTKMEGYPLLELIFNPVMDTQWPRAEVDNLKGLQDQINILDQQTADFYGRLMACLLIKENSMDPEEIDKLMDARYDEPIMWRNSKPETFTGPSLTGEFFARRKELMEIAERESHLPEWLLVGRSMRARSATEADALQEGLRGFVGEKLDVVEEFMAEVYKKEFQLMQETYTLSQTVPILGPLGLEWRRFSIQDIEEELDVGIVHFSSLPESPQLELRKLKEALSIAGAVAQAVPGLMKMGMIVRRLFERLLPGEDVDEFFNDAAMLQLEQDVTQQQLLGQLMQRMQSQTPGTQGEANMGQPVVPPGATPGAS